MKKNILKIVILLSIIVALQSIIGPMRTAEGSWGLKRFRNQIKGEVDVFYFGDSTSWYTAKADKDKRSIARMLRDRLQGGNIRVGDVTNAAYHLEVYAAYVERIARSKRKPPIVIIPINMRSFSPVWDMNPAYQFEKEKIALRGGLKSVFYHPLRVLKYRFNTVTNKDFRNAPVYNGDKRIGKLKKMRNLRQLLVLHYMYRLDRKHRKVKALERIVRIAARHGIMPVFYITPIDYKVGENKHPGQFVKRLKTNTELLKAVLEETGEPYRQLDLSMDLGSGFFAWQAGGSPNEHLNQQGRRYVAERLAACLETNRP